MDNSNMSKNRPNEYLGVNKIGKHIRKSPLHQPKFVHSDSGNNNNAPAREQPPQPQVYNISKSDFRSIVQQLTGSPSRHDPLPRPPNNPPKHPSMRLQRIRPPPLTPIHRPPMPPMQPPPQGPAIDPLVVPFNNNNNNNNNFAVLPPQFGQPSPRRMQPLGPGDSSWPNPAMSPISAYMQQLQSCIVDGGPRSDKPMLHPQVPGQAHGQPLSYGMLPEASMPPFPSPRTNGPAPLLSPTSQFLLPSPSGLFNLLSPTSRSPYPLLSPGSQFPPPLGPNLAFSPMGQYGMLGPLSPSGFFPISSPRWGG